IAPNLLLQKRQILAWGVRPARVQEEMAFRIIKPTKIAVSDRPNICVALCSFVLSTCAIARSFVFVMMSIPTSQFRHQQGNAKARRGGRASIRRDWSTIERVTKLYVSAIRRYEDGGDVGCTALRPLSGHRECSVARKPSFTPVRGRPRCLPSLRTRASPARTRS